MKTIDLINNLYSKILKERAILRLIDNDTFKLLYENASDEDKLVIEKHISNLNIKDLRYFIRLKAKLEIEDMPVGDLKMLAKDLGVKYYTCLTKDKLIYQIRRLKDR